MTLQADPSNSHIEVLVDTYDVAAEARWDVANLPSIEIDFVQDGSEVIPVQRGAQAGQHPYWEWIFEPGKAWDDTSAPGWTRVSLPFSLQERNQNCTHNGLIRFTFKDDGAISPAHYLVGSETCHYLKANMRGAMATTFQPGDVRGAERVIAEHRAMMKSRLPVKAITSLAADYPGTDPGKFVPPGPEDVTVYGLVIDGTHYRGGCETRFGPHPYCEWLDLPSYSIAKSVFAGLVFIRLEQLYPGFAGLEVTDLVPECKLPDGRWDGVTLWHLLNMTTGNYDDSGFEVDEGAAKVAAFFLPETHAEKLDFSCRAYTRKAPPGETFVYHTSDTYLLGTAMNTFLRRKQGEGADIFRDIYSNELFGPLGLSPLVHTSRRTYDHAAQPFSGYGLTWNPDDIARIGSWLNTRAGEGGLFAGSEALQHALFRDPAKIRRWAQARGEAYSNGFWGFDIASWAECSDETWVPFMSGYGGNIVALIPNGSVYYYFSDGNRFSWAPAAAESNKIRRYCD